MATPTVGPRPGKMNLRLRRGSTFAPAPFTYRVKDGPVIDLTGYTARAQLRDVESGELIIPALTTENGGITLGGVDGTIALVVTAAATTLIDDDFVAGKWDLELVSGSVVTPLLAGSVLIDDEVTV